MLHGIDEKFIYLLNRIPPTTSIQPSIYLSIHPFNYYIICILYFIQWFLYITRCSSRIYKTLYFVYVLNIHDDTNIIIWWCHFQYMLSQNLKRFISIAADYWYIEMLYWILYNISKYILYIWCYMRYKSVGVVGW